MHAIDEGGSPRRESSLDYDRERSQNMSADWDLQGTPGPGQYDNDKQPTVPVPAFTFASSGRDTQAKMYIGKLHSEAAGESISAGPAQYNCSRDFATGLLVDVCEARKGSAVVLSKVKKGVTKGIGMPLSTRTGDGKRLILRSVAPSGSVDDMPAPGQYTPRLSRTGGTAICENNRSLRWNKPPRESSVEAKAEVPPVGTYTPLHTQTMTEGPHLTFTTTPRTTSLKKGGVDTPAPAAYSVPSLKRAPRTAFGKANRDKESLKMYTGKRFMVDSIGIDSPGPAWCESTPNRLSDRATPRATIGRADKAETDKQYSGGGSNFINDGGGYNRSLTHLGPGSYDLAKSTLSPRGMAFAKSQRVEMGARASGPGPASYTPTVTSAFDRPGYSIAGSNTLKSSTADVPGPGAYIDQSVQSMVKAYAEKPAVSFTRSRPSPRQYLGHGMVSGAGLDVPGPVYNIERGAKVICDKPAPAWGNSKASRSRTSTGEANPGPGEYAPNFEGAKQQKKGSSFGKSKREFTFIRYSDVPGPSAYTPRKPEVHTPRAAFGSGQRTSFAKTKF